MEAGVNHQRRMLVIRRWEKGAPKDQFETRLFWMSLAQAHSYNQTVGKLVKSGSPPFQAEAAVQQVVFKMMQGKMPGPKDPPEFHELRLRFPILSEEDIERLPVAGCPHGQIEGMTLSIQIEGQGERIIKLEFSTVQAEAYNTALADLVEVNDCSRDEAWFMLNRTIGALLCGQTVKMEGETQLLDDVVELFQPMDGEAVQKLPVATDEDVRRLSFRETA